MPTYKFLNSDICLTKAGKKKKKRGKLSEVGKHLVIFVLIFRPGHQDQLL